MKNEDAYGKNAIVRQRRLSESNRIDKVWSGHLEKTVQKIEWTAFVRRRNRLKPEWQINVYHQSD
tara:strand:+ start:113 stop:307 length:195 start_codon:yes stop_codon:yes gene_type:complete